MWIYNYKIAKMSDIKQYKTRCLKVDLINDRINFEVKRFGTTRQKSLDKQIVKKRMIPHFPIRMGSSANSTSSDECSKIESNFKLDSKSTDDEKLIFDAHLTSKSDRRNTTE